MIVTRKIHHMIIAIGQKGDNTSLSLVNDIVLPIDPFDDLLGSVHLHEHKTHIGLSTKPVYMSTFRHAFDSIVPVIFNGIRIDGNWLADAECTHHHNTYYPNGSVCIEKWDTFTPQEFYSIGDLIHFNCIYAIGMNHVEWNSAMERCISMIDSIQALVAFTNNVRSGDPFNHNMVSRNYVS
jgi:hypothetical protein